MTKLHTVSKYNFQKCLSEEKLTRISVLNTKGSILKKINVSLLIFILENTA